MSDLPKDPRYQFTYRVAEFLNDALYDRYQHDDGTLFRRLMSYHETLSESEEISFVPFCGNHVEILNVDIPEPCVVNYGEEFMNESFYEIDGEKAVAAEAIQIFESFLDLFPLEIADGRGFIESDFRYMKDRRIPVIMGSEYKELFETGDIFEGYYLFERVSFEVIGIAKSGNSFYHPAVGPALYDRYIIMPFERVTNDSPFSRLQLLQEQSALTFYRGISGENAKLKRLLHVPHLVHTSQGWKDVEELNLNAPIPGIRHISQEQYLQETHQK